MPDGRSVRVVWSQETLVDGEPFLGRPRQKTQQLGKAGVDALVCAPDTWAFPQLRLISLLGQFPKDFFQKRPQL